MVVMARGLKSVAMAEAVHRRHGSHRDARVGAGETAGGAEAAAKKRAGMMLARLLLRPLFRGLVKP